MSVLVRHSPMLRVHCMLTSAKGSPFLSRRSSMAQSHSSVPAQSTRSLAPSSWGNQERTETTPQGSYPQGRAVSVFMMRKMRPWPECQTRGLSVRETFSLSSFRALLLSFFLSRAFRRQMMKCHLIFRNSFAIFTVNSMK